MPTRRIIVLDGNTLNPGDISWGPFEALGELEVHPRSSAEEVLTRARGCELVLTNKALLPKSTLEQLPQLEYIGVLATGTNVVDVQAAKERGVVVTNVPEYGTRAVAQHVFALLLEMTNHTAAHGAAVERGDWARCADFTFTVAPINELEGKTLGVVGLGAIGGAVARLGHAIGMHLLAATNQRSRPDVGVPVRWLSLDELLHHADVVSLHCPLSAATERLMDATRLNQMRGDAYLVNTSRGQLIDESALRRALDAGHLAGAALDVLSAEPPPSDHPLIGAPRCLITPHVAWASVAARQRLMQTAAKNLQCFLEGEPQNVVS